MFAVLELVSHDGFMREKKRKLNLTTKPLLVRFSYFSVFIF